MKMPSFLIAVSCMVTLVALKVDAAAPVLDQSFVPPSWGQLISVGTSTNAALAQTFTVGTAGTLTGFAGYIEDAGGIATVLWDIQPTVDGIPVMSDSAALASGSFSSTAAPQNRFGFYSINLGASSFAVTPGEVLAIVFRTAPGYNGVSISWQGAAPNPYAPGYAFVGLPAGVSGVSDTAWFTGNLAGYDLGFETFVEPVPEPSSAFLILVGVCVVLGIRRRIAA